MKKKVDWKSQLEKQFKLEKFNCDMRLVLILQLKWKNYPLIRKAAEVKTFISDGTQLIDSTDKNSNPIQIEVPKIVRYLTEKELANKAEELKEQLLDWFDRMILNYDDLTVAQKNRIKYYKLVEENKQLTNFAKMKLIKVREYINKRSYHLVKKTVIIELL
jgi:hypothetical protein